MWKVLNAKQKNVQKISKYLIIPNKTVTAVLNIQNIRLKSDLLFTETSIRRPHKSVISNVGCMPHQWGIQYFGGGCLETKSTAF